MAETSYDLTVSELRDLRAWRLLLIEAYGRVHGLDELAFTRAMPLDDALSALGLGGSVWASEHWLELRSALEAPVEMPAPLVPSVPEAA
ncbi:MAG TPA: hypothetical protein IAA22_08105 [Candidatus Olsenella stercoravium]|uniref:Uncharacterized protein n=1 Tax=Candidatus Olsenella stercoravium TaxID=2838713 RepID=A0A9D2IQU0_9ACTN|nr:hypothetical protein [Candidatus Olsenella stercoravium]